MNEDSELELEESSEESEDEAYVEYDITSYPSDYTLEGLQQQRERGDIVVPPYQRKYVWNIRQASLLVESFLLGLPVPPLFLYITEDNKSEVIDGQQRLLTVCYFLEGYFGEPNKAGLRKTFSLTGLSEKSPFRDKTFNQLEERHQRKFRGSVLRAVNIRQLSPIHNNTSVFHIFERLNTGGTSLKPQEIRNAVFRGPIVKALKDLNSNPLWQSILGLKQPDKFQRDVELVLRLFSLFQNWNEYEKPMKEFLNRSMKSNSEFDGARARNFTDLFEPTLRKINSAFGDKPFRPRRVINAAVLEAVMISLLEKPEISEEGLRENYQLLMEDGRFVKVIRGATTDTKTVIERLSIASEVLGQ